MKRFCSLVAFVAALSVGSQTFAHHATQAEFDQTKVTTIKGVMTRVMWVNPHVNWHMEVKNADGTVTDWTIVGAGPGQFRAIGLSGRDFFQIGETYSASIALARNGSSRGHIMSFVTPDGKTLQIWTGNGDDPLGR
jgi:hypothetical protein